MEQMITANIALDISGIVLSLIPIVYLISNRRYRQKLNLYFLGIAVSNIFMIIGDLADWLMRGNLQPPEKILLIFLTSLYYIASAFMLYFFAKYMDEYLHLSVRIRKPYLTFVVLMCSIQIFFAVISPFTGSIFYITEEGYNRGNLFLISQIIPFICYISFTSLVIVYQKKLTWQEIVFFLLYIYLPLIGEIVQTLLRGIAVVNIGVSIALLLVMINIQFEHEIKMRQQEQELTEMRIDMMLSQIQPHFLFNVLTGIRKLCETNPKQAAISIGAFSKFLRTNMESLTDKNPIPFEKELSHTKAYLELECLRFGDKLTVLYEIEAVNFSVPPLTLQPIAENAVRHGLMKKENGGTLKIVSGETDDSFYITVTDDGIGFSEDSYKNGDDTHIGIANVRNRLQTLCNGSVNIESAPGKGTVVTIEIPKEGEKK